MKNKFVKQEENSWLPEILNVKEEHCRQRFNEIIAPGNRVAIIDHFKLQKIELLKTRMPGKPVTADLLEEQFNNLLQGADASIEGLWIFYPWLNKIVHTLNKEEFIELRTNRNYYKITPAEQRELSSKTLGIIGLSVGHAVAVCMATERICGKLKLADFDVIELSNLNRIKTGIVNLGINKAIVTAREIAEIDPFIEVDCYTEGITENNLESFLLQGGKLDVLIDECDGLDIKIQCRQAAKQHGIPVVMETSDKGMLDVERFDIEDDRPILHGLLNGIPLNGLKNLSNEQKIPLILKIADVNKGSVRGKVSMLEVGRSISTWPQLASSVTLGGAVVTDVCRRILLDQYHESGRYYVDIESIAGNNKSATASKENPFSPFDINRAFEYIELSDEPTNTVKVPYEQLEQIVAYANMAPSTGNDQPWKWVFAKGRLYLFHDEFRSFSFGDFDNIASDLSFGAAYENLQLKAWEFGYSVRSSLYPDASNKTLIASIEFFNAKDAEKGGHPFAPNLVTAIPSRITNRNSSQPINIPEEHVLLIKEAAESVNGAKLHCLFDKQQIKNIGSIIGECDRIRLLNPLGHTDFVSREMRWTPAQAESTRDGIDIRTLGLSGPFAAALSIVRDAEVAAALKKIDGGKALVDAAVATAVSASMLGIIILPKYSRANFFAAGVSLERMWLQATALGYIVHPLISPFYLFPRVTKGKGDGLDEGEIKKLRELRNLFSEVLPLNDDEAEAFIFKLAAAPEPVTKTLRLPVEKTLFMAK
jgi:molybdopterin/thiamine biosynthesis adenylyltransferase